jgi:hypothetical protein
VSRATRRHTQTYVLHRFGAMNLRLHNSALPAILPQHSSLVVSQTDPTTNSHQPPSLKHTTPQELTPPPPNIGLPLVRHPPHPLLPPRHPPTPRHPRPNLEYRLLQCASQLLHPFHQIQHLPTANSLGNHPANPHPLFPIRQPAPVPTRAVAKSFREPG